MKRNLLKSLIPGNIKRLAKDLLGLTSVDESMAAMQRRVDRLEELLYESNEATSERSKTRWRATAPTTGLTWGKEAEGTAFILKAASYSAFSGEKTILEIGPGYGRLLKAILKQQIPFSRYLGIDISADNIKYLKENFSSPKISFLYGDAESVSLDDTFDVVLSSLVLKHLFPSFERALRNISNHLNPECMVFFDLIEGKERYFERDGVTYIRHYTKAEILEIVEHSSLDIVAFDEVQHNPDHRRLVVVAKK